MEYPLSPFVIDTGSGSSKCGVAGDDAPKACFPSIVGHLRNSAPGSVISSMSTKDSFVGSDAQSRRGILAIQNPIERGLIVHWDDMEKLWQHCFSELHVESVDRPVLLSESPTNPKEHREKTTELMFERFKTPSLFLCTSAALSLTSNGRTTGLVLESGDQVTHAVPVYEGHVVPHGTSRSDFGGRDISTFLMSLLNDHSNASFESSDSRETIRDLKEKVCAVAQQYDLDWPTPEKWHISEYQMNRLRTGLSSQPRSWLSRLPVEIQNEVYCFASSRPRFLSQKSRCLVPSKKYDLPDGKVIEVSGEDRIRAAEALFNPSLMNFDKCDGFIELLDRSIYKCDYELRRDLYGYVCLAGGNTMLPGTCDRIERDFFAAPMELRVRIVAAAERALSAWIGGSIFASISSFNQKVITKADYDEFGPKIVHLKCW